MLSRACQQRHGIQALSLEADPAGNDNGDADFDFREALADTRADPPEAAARRRLDLPRILDRERVSPKARATLRYLAETHAAGKLTELAAELKVDPKPPASRRGTVGDYFTTLARLGGYLSRSHDPPAERYTFSPPFTHHPLGEAADGSLGFTDADQAGVVAFHFELENTLRGGDSFITFGVAHGAEGECRVRIGKLHT